MLRRMNRYCSNCLRTRRFLDLGTHLVCECCSKRLDRVRPVPVPARRGRLADWPQRRIRRSIG